MIPGSGGCRKVRWRRQGTDKSGGVGVIYFTRLKSGELWLLVIYAKSVRGNIPAHYSVQVSGTPMKVVNFSEARNRLKSILDQVVSDADYTIISRRDAEDAVVMSLDQFNGLMETVHLLKNPANAAHLGKSIKQYRSGKTENHGLIDD